MHTCADLISSVPFLEDAEDDFVRYLVTQLHPTVSSPKAVRPVLPCVCLLYVQGNAAVTCCHVKR